MGGLSGLVVSRLIREQGSGPAWARPMLGSCLLALALALVALALGLRGPWIVALAWFAVVGVGVGAGTMLLRPMLAVSVTGLALGVASLFVVLGVASGVEEVLIRSLARLNGHAMVTKYGLDFFEYDAVADQLEADPRVRAASPFVFGVGALVAIPDPAIPDPGASGSVVRPQGADVGPVVVTIKGLDPRRVARFSDVDLLFAAGGVEALRPADPGVAPGIVLGVRLARRLDLEQGARVRLVVPAAISGDLQAEPGPPRYGEFEVTGLVDTGFAEFDASFVLVHLSAAQALIYGEFRVTGVELELASTEGLSAAMPTAEALVEVLNAPRVEQGKLPYYRPASWVEGSAILNSIRQTKALLVVVLGLIVLVASGSLIGALLLLLRQKRREIATLAALGATPRQLFWIFELVGVGVGALGSACGLILGGVSLGLLQLMRFGLDPDVYMIDHLPVAFVGMDLAIPVVMATLMCALVSGPVAARAARLRPIDALR